MRFKGCYNDITSRKGSFFAPLHVRRGRYKPTYLMRVGILRGQPLNLSGGAELMRVKITLACSECKQRNYDTMKNKKNDPDRLELNKYCRFCRKHTLHKETK